MRASGVCGHEVADLAEELRVRRGIRARRAADRRLVDVDDLVDQLEAVDAIVLAGRVDGVVEVPRQRLVEDVVDERRLAGAADAGDGDEDAERDLDVEVLEVVLPRAADDELVAVRPGGARAGTSICASPRRYFAVSELGKVLICSSVPSATICAAVHAGARAEVDDVVGGLDRLLVVLDDDDRVAEVAQLEERLDQLAVVALVQADRRLVEHVEHAHQLRADLRRQADALRLAAGERGRVAVERQIADADGVEEAEAVADFLEDLAGDRFLARGEVHVAGRTRPRRGAAARRSGRSAGPRRSR